MRHGSNPLKEQQTAAAAPARITVGVLNYIPFEEGFFEGHLDVLKLCLASLRHHAGHPFDLLVLDNASCDAVRAYLLAENAAGRIDYLILNGKNVGYPNGMLQLLHAAPGDWVFYADGDVYFRKGWMQAHLDIATTFPDIGLVTGVPIRGAVDYCTQSTARWIEAHQADLTLERGDLIPEAWTAEFAAGLGFPGEVEKAYGPHWRTQEDCRVTYQGVPAFVGGIPMQFLTSQAAIAHLARQHPGPVLDKPEVFLDTVLDAAGLQRLSTAQPYAYHMGNRILEDWLAEAYRDLVGTRAVQPRGPAPQQHWLWGRRKVRRLLRRLHQWAFEKDYGHG